MKTKIIFLCAVFLVAQAITYGQKTAVSVQKGKILAQTAGGIVTVNAGQKAVLKEGQKPQVDANEPMVNDLIVMDKWAQAEREAKKIRIDGTLVSVIRIETEKQWKGAFLAEMPNNDSKPSNTCRMGLTSILNKPKYYDMEGNLISFDLEKKNERQGYYYLHFDQLVASEEKFKFICITDFEPTDNRMFKKGNIWQMGAANDSPYWLNFFKVILPKTAVFVSATPSAMLVDETDGRVAVTIRNYTGKTARGHYTISFVWPAKDQLLLSDLPWHSAGPEAVTLYEEFINENIQTPQLWGELGIKLVGGFFLDEAFDAFSKCYELNGSKIWRFTAIIWQGHIYDILGERKKALEKYEDALKHLPDEAMRHDQWGIVLTRKWVERRLEEPFTEEMLQAPQRVSEFNERLKILPWDKAGPEAVALYTEFADANVTVGAGWGVLGLKLVGGGYWDEAFDAFSRSCNLENDQVFIFTALVWQGHIYDIWSQREEALSKYEQALKIEKFDYMRHDQWGIVLNYKWVKDRLETPFTREMIGR